MKRRQPTSATSLPRAVRPEPDDFIVTMKDVASRKDAKGRLPHDRSTIHRWIQNGTFPAPIVLSPGTKGWWWSTIVRWVAEQEQHPSKARAYFKRRRQSTQPSLDTTTA